MTDSQNEVNKEDEVAPMQWTLPSQANLRERPMWWALLLLLALVAYVPAIRSNFIWDDNRHVTENKNLRDTDGLVNIWTKRGLLEGGTPQYYPLTHTMYWLEYQAWGDDPLGYHLVNVVLHGLSAVLVWEILRRLNVPGAWAAAAIWALHPINVETVAWVSEGKNVLAGVFFFSSILAYLEGKGIGSRNPQSEIHNPKSPIPPLGWFGISFGLFVCALLSKTVACSMPAVMLLILWWKKQLKAKDFAILVPFLLVGAALGLATAQMEREYVGAVGPEWQFSIADRFLIAGRALWFYAATLIAPVKQSFIYTRWTDYGAAWGWVFPAGFLAVIALLVLSRKRLGNGPLVAVLYFAGTLFPALGFFNVYPMRYSFVADHFQYLSGLGLIVLGVVVLTKILRSTSVAAVATVMVLGVLITVTWVRANVFYDEVTVWQDTLAKNPTCWMAHHNLGVALHHEAMDYRRAGAIDDASKDLTEAENQYKLALKYNPRHEWAHFGLGSLYMVQHKWAEARLIDALFVEQHDWMNFGEAPLYATARWAVLAETELENSIAPSPDPSKSYAQLGLLMMELHKFDSAESDLRKAMELEDKPLKKRVIPMHIAETRIALAKLDEAKGNLKEAEQLYLDALKLKPSSREAKLRVGILLGARGDVADAAEAFKSILRDDQNDWEAWKYLGNALAMKGDVRFAEEAIKVSLQLKPDQKDAQQTLALIHKAMTHDSARPTTAPALTGTTQPANPSATQPATAVVR